MSLAGLDKLLSETNIRIEQIKLPLIYRLIMSFNEASKLGQFYGRVIYRPEPINFAPNSRPKEPMTMTQLNEYYDRIVLGNLCLKCDEDFVAEGEKFCPKCSKRPEITIGSWR